MKKKIMLVASLILLVVLIIVATYFYGLTPVKNKSEKVIFTIDSGSSTKSIIKELENENLIKSKISSYIYIFIHKDLVMKAGTYELDRNDSARTIFRTIDEGKVYDDSIKITFKEGKRVTDYASLIAEEFNYEEEEIINTINDKEFLEELISKYWFLTNEAIDDNIYYALEGYLFPDTYLFDKKADIKSIIIKMLDNTELKLESYKSALETTEYTVHDILTMASIIENESMFDEDRPIVSQVIYKRLNVNMSLGMDVTTYYSVHKDLSEALTTADLNTVNSYNTRVTSFIGLPVGPISNPSIKSIEAALNPSDTNYLYFYADIKTGKLHFAEDSAGFQKLIETYR